MTLGSHSKQKHWSKSTDSWVYSKIYQTAVVSFRLLSITHSLGQANPYFMLKVVFKISNYLNLVSKKQISERMLNTLIFFLMIDKNNSNIIKQPHMLV